jgi:hypothetical protein
MVNVLVNVDSYSKATNCIAALTHKLNNRHTHYVNSHEK